jgi:hypothetical protein
VRWCAALRPVGLLLIVAGLLLIGFQSRTNPRSTQRGPAKITSATAASVKFPPPERKGLSPDQSGESMAARFVPPPFVATAGAVRRLAAFGDAPGRPGIRLRAPPIDTRPL